MAVLRTDCLFVHCSLFYFNDNSVIHMVTAPQHSYYLKDANSVIKKGSQLHICITCCLQTAYTYISYISIYQHVTAIRHKSSIYTPCVAALILSECTNSSCEAARSALSQTAPNIVNLDLLLVT